MCPGGWERCACAWRRKGTLGVQKAGGNVYAVARHLLRLRGEQGKCGGVEERWAELLGVFWKQAPVAVLEKVEYSVLGVQRVLFWGLKSMGEHYRTALIAFGHVH